MAALGWLRVGSIGMLLVLGTTSCGPASDAVPANVILITVDTLRADRLGCYGYYRDTSPNIDSFATEAVLFENAFSAAGTTLPSHVSLMTSTHAVRHGVYGNRRPFDAAQSRVVTLAQVLAGAGYETAAFVSAVPVKRNSGIGVGFQTFVEPDGAECPGGETTKRVLAWLDEGPNAPFFLWVHYFDPHDPYFPPAPFDEMFPVDQDQRLYLERSEYTYWDHPDIESINSQYDGEVRYLDSQLAILFHGLDERGLYDEAAIVLTADHGEGLGQHDWVIHDKIHGEILGVPLILKLPGMKGADARRHEAIVGTVDVVPTLVEELGIPVPPEIRGQFEGRNLLGSPSREFVFSERIRDRPDKLGPGNKSTLTSLEWKYTSWTEGPDELFHLASDSLETRNVIELYPEIATDMSGRIAARLERAKPVPDGNGEDVDPERLEELRALGYVD